MTRFLFAPIAAFALLMPSLASGQVKTEYIPGAHPRVVVVPAEDETKVQRAPLTPAEIIAIHTRMAAALRGNLRVDYSAVAHCDRLVAEARAALRKKS